MRFMTLCVALLTACATQPTTVADEQTLCTIEDQEAGLCDGPLTRAYVVAADNGYDPYNDPRVLTGCLPGSGSCYVVVTEIGGQCKNWFAICSPGGMCTTGCMPNPNDIPMPQMVAAPGALDPSAIYGDR